MPADFSALFDPLLVLAGLVLVITGLVMFIRSKTSTQASSVEAFGIKLNVTHPSLILVLAGVGLMLAPRLLPEQADQAGKPEPAAVAEAPQTAAPAIPTPAEPASQATRTPTPTPVAAEAAPATLAAKPAVSPPKAPPPLAVAQASRPLPPTKPRPATTDVPKKTTPRIAAAHPAAVTSPEEPVSKPPAAKPARPTLAYAALALPISRSFWGGETRASYTRRLQNSLQQAGRDVLHTDARGLELGEKEFDTWWNESNQHPKSRELCAAAPAPRALLSARVETPTTISSVESAYWPELKLRLFDCASQRIHRQQKTLAPQNDDAWPFASELNSEVERFLRTYRADLHD
jgi:uncharacterized protein YjeT (DUF2065 family)